MTWLRVDDQIAFAASTIAAGNAAMGAWLRMSAWCAAQLSDGAVPRALAGTMATPTELKALAAAGLIVDHGDTIEVVGFLDTNPSRVEVLAHRETRQASARTAARARWDRASTNATTDANGMRDVCVDASPSHVRVNAPSRPVPSSPGPTPPDPSEPRLERAPAALLTPSEPAVKKGRAKKQATEAPDTTDAPAFADFCAKWKLDVRDPLVARMCDHYKGLGESRTDWAATARKWRSNEPAFAPRTNGKHVPVQPSTPPEERAYAFGRQNSEGT